MTNPQYNQTLTVQQNQSSDLTKSSETLPVWINNKSELRLYNASQLSKRIKDFDVIDNAQIIKFLANWRVELGVTTKLKPEESDLLDAEMVSNMRFIIENFPEMSIETLNLAKNYAFGGVLKLETVSCFNNFSPLYIGQVLRAYLNHEATAVLDILKRKHAHESKPIEKSTEEKAALMIEYLQTYSNLVATSDSYVHGMGPLWDFMERVGLVHESLCLDLKVREQADKLKTVKKDAYGRIMVVLDEATFEKNCRFLVLKKYFTDNQVDFRGYSPEQILGL